jgi:SAM-dependent methyltransferase
MLRLRYVASVLRALHGVHLRHCSCCGYIGRFKAFGSPPRYDAQCTNCGALERHRLFVLVSETLTLFSRPKDVLHLAPEQPVRAYLHSRARTYVTADRSGVDVDRRENIEALSFENGRFDVVVCSHVLEHVDDAKALRELHRILRTDGLLVCMVPIIEGWDRTYENPGIVTPFERTLHFGQSDHLRFYGRDFRDRLKSAGFHIDEHTATGELAVQHGLLFGEKVFVCAKSLAAT